MTPSSWKSRQERSSTPFVLIMVCTIFEEKFMILIDKIYWNSMFIYGFVTGNLCMITGGRNLGRVGAVVNRERHQGSFDICHIKDSQGHTFATR